MNTAEQTRLDEAREGKAAWKKWGPYLSERQWGTVREDYSENGDAWNFFTHDHARSRAYRWGEDGLAGISDDKQRLCFALALWNGKDPILKERLFGLTNSEGNHGEDVKEYYFYLDSTPTHSYMKFLYKYPHAAYPYADLLQTNGRRSREEMEYELLDTGVFTDDRYFDVFVEYAKGAAEDILVRITAVNRGPEAADLHLLPTLWFRNDWSAWIAESNRAARKPTLRQADAPSGVSAASVSHPLLGEFVLSCEGDVPLLFTENETNHERLFPGQQNESTHVKDGINDCVVHGRQDAVNPEKQGTKVAAHYKTIIGAGQTEVIRVRLSRSSPKPQGPFGKAFDDVFAARLREADEFYVSVTPPSVSADAANVMRQALAGMLWSKQFFFFDGDNWLDEHNSNPLHHGYRHTRNSEWYHMLNEDIISMPDKWEYPWYAAWDLAFHTLPLSIVDPDFAKHQMELMLRGAYLHPNGQMPAYEWNFSDVNPPVHAFATLFLYRTEQAQRGKPDLDFLRSTFNKLLLNFTWWVNRKDRFGKNVFEGGFLGLDNIGVFDRSAPLPTGGHLEQADGTAWMALFSENMLELAIELAAHDPVYESMVFKFVEHFYYIAAAMNRSGPEGMWDEEDGFYYDILRLPDGSASRLKVRSLVGLLPLCATTVIEKSQREQIPNAMAYAQERLRRIPELSKTIHPTGVGHFGVAERGVLALVNPERLRRILTKMLDENEFLGPHGIRSISKFHERNPYVFHADGQEYRVDYLPAESNTGMFGGNSNWRGPVWMPVNVLIIRALQNFYLYYGDNFKIECPTGSGRLMNLFEVSKEISDRLVSTFTRDDQGRRPVYGGSEKFQTDPHWRDYILFYEYFHADNGAGLGASHQTGWTGLVAKLIELYGVLDPERALEMGKKAAFEKGATNTRRQAMKPWPRHPVIYEVNTWVWLNDLSRTHKKGVDLSTVPDEEWDAIAAGGFDAVWLMGVWERSPAGIGISMRNDGLLQDFKRALPDFSPQDNVGSPYCVRRYVVDEHLGGPKGLAAARRKLGRRGLRLILDFVPNHVAPDNPWASDHPEYFIHGSAENARNDPASFIERGGTVFACGRDPFFPAWPDVLQLNTFHPGLRQAMIETVSEIADQCDAVRCDMAMLVLNAIFERTWGGVAGSKPDTDYWTTMIPAIKGSHPEFRFIAEAYWDLEWELQQHGFDFCYDKKLYDRMEHGPAESVRQHLLADLSYQEGMVRFIENHDEPRAAAAFPDGKSRAAAVAILTLPGARLLHEGQFEGWRVRLPVFLARRPAETVDRDLAAFYRSLLNVTNRDLFRNGTWRLCDRSGWPDNQSCENVLAWSWVKDHERALVVVNYGQGPAQARVHVPWDELRGATWRLHDELSGDVYDRDGNEMRDSGLYVDLAPWQCHIFQMRAQ